ncbi:putative ESAT-6-like protein 6 [Mycobacterium marinum]|nr:putative ESAT-6-like protein 6 [Mycobacterium marinum]RFZ70942.1 putative ESAT-6-like protein 6 [Mycobacterium marinum]
MTINYQFGDVDAHGALIRAQAASLEAEHQAIVRDVLAAGDFWGGAGSVACQEFITQLGRNFQVIYEQANSHGQAPVRWLARSSSPSWVATSR